jgi:uncharacterized damage-inducible protein DinB
MSIDQPEVWLRGPIDDVDPVLMPAAHAFLQTGEDIERALAGLSTEQIWRDPGGAASVGFHVLHLMGSTDRLLTYARGETLTDAQRARLASEKNPAHTDSASLIADLRTTIDAAITQLRKTPISSINEPRIVGRAALPTTVLGLLFHAAEHGQRHAGQVVTTRKIVESASKK